MKSISLTSSLQKPRLCFTLAPIPWISTLFLLSKFFSPQNPFSSLLALSLSTSQKIYENEQIDLISSMTKV